MRALAERADHVIVVSLFASLAAGWADLILPATGTLEREGTSMNLEGRVQRLRRAVIAPVPDELAWLAKLAARFDVGPLAVRRGRVRGALRPDLRRMRAGRGSASVLRSRRACRTKRRSPPHALSAHSPEPNEPGDHFVGTLRLLRYRPLFSGPEIERIPELQFQRPEREVALSAADADRRGISTGDAVSLRSNGTSVELRARIDPRLLEGVARIAEEHASDLHLDVEVVRV